MNAHRGATLTGLLNQGMSHLVWRSLFHPLRCESVIHLSHSPVFGFSVSTSASPFLDSHTIPLSTVFLQ